MIYVLLPDGFEEIEAVTPIDVLRRCGQEVLTVGVDGKNAKGAHGINTLCDIELKDLNKDDMTMLVLPGGPGHTRFFEEDVLEVIDYASKNNICISAICAAPSVLGKLGILKGKKATCYPGFEKDLLGAFVEDEKVSQDELLITAKGPGAASEFAFMLAQYLCGKDKAREVKNAMQY